jgi:hypothetical protein
VGIGNEGAAATTPLAVHPARATEVQRRKKAENFKRIGAAIREKA